MSDSQVTPSGDDEMCALFGERGALLQAADECPPTHAGDDERDRLSDLVWEIDRRISRMIALSRQGMRAKLQLLLGHTQLQCAASDDAEGDVIVRELARNALAEFDLLVGVDS